MEPAIDISGIGKTFKLVTGQPASIKSAVLAFRRPKPRILTGLANVNIRIEHGEAVAIIGRNGSGKSTLLRIIGRVYRPSSGSVTVNGRMATLLDLGAGFHPELTGRENVFFNAAVMGLSRAQAKEKIDGIIGFSELADYIDAPVRTYSAGMLMRLGFAVAMEVDPQILLIDEVLAVGDAEFQEKCYSRIKAFKDGGGTIVFVTHEMEAAKLVAGRAVWISGGRVAADGPTTEVVASYLSNAHEHVDGSVTNVQ